MTGTPSNLNPLSYTGIDPKEQPRFFKINRAPSTTDYIGYEVGDQWLDISLPTPNVHILISVQNNMGTWLLLGSSGTTLLANSVVLGQGTSVPNTTAPLTDGQLVIGDTGNTPVTTTLTAGSNITITNGPGSIQIDSADTGVIQGNVTAFSPVLTFGGSATGITGTLQGYYLKTGKLVDIDILISITSKGSATGIASIASLPFTIATPGINYDPQFSGSYGNLNLSLGANVVGTGVSGGTSIELHNSIAPNAIINLTNVEFTNTSTVVLSGRYFTT